MTVDKHSQDALAKLYAEWVSAGVKLSVAGFAASTKIMEAATQSVLSARAKANESIRAREAGSSAKAEQPATPEPEVRAKPLLRAVAPVTVEKAAIAPEKFTPVKSETAPAIRVKTAEISMGGDLKQISGIGPKLEQMLQKRGLKTLADIAALSNEAAANLDADLGLDGRISRDGWIAQAEKLAGG